MSIGAHLIGATSPSVEEPLEPEFRSIPGRLRPLAAWWRPIDSGEVGEVVKLTLFGHQPCQSAMSLSEDALKRKCRSEPNVDPARADRDHGADL
jgi:hypothetical protein